MIMKHINTIADFVIQLKNINMIKTLQLLKFFFISVPLACMLFVTAHILFELKRLIYGKKK